MGRHDPPGDGLKKSSGECFGSFEEAEIALAARSTAGFVEEVAVCSFMQYLSNIFEGWQCARKLGKRNRKGIRKIPACSWLHGLISTDTKDFNTVCFKYKV